MLSRARRYTFLIVSAFLLWLAVSCIALALTTAPKGSPNYTQFGRSINIGPSDEVGELTCIACNIHVRGLVAGDVTAIGGSIVVTDEAQVSGDVTSVGGDLRLTKEVKIAGDVTVIGGQLHRDPETSVTGEITALSGGGWLLLIFVVPLVLFGLLLAFVIWLIQRLRRPPVPVHAA